MFEFIFVFMLSGLFWVRATYYFARRPSYGDLFRDLVEKMDGGYPVRCVGMDYDTACKLVGFVTEEMLELLREYTINPRDAFMEILKRVKDPRDPEHVSNRDAGVLDAIGDALGYLMFAAVRAGYPIDAAVREIHAGVLRKRFPDGRFHRDPNTGKTMKPSGYVPANMDRVLKRYRL